ncbi:hypothetical protein K9N08_02835 [Candidatus Gracilibacteria bacterium]|nr:hypothetical protein [Candidatus Gracilibacteria bacterium]MCF7856468.1 hypothetical protein [Candidatus Gracilibacteria bacterium]MCF7896764.1 hypothetical protein [Candidatus Gracilibacteria bacterium]
MAKEETCIIDKALITSFGNLVEARNGENAEGATINGVRTMVGAICTDCVNEYTAAFAEACRVLNRGRTWEGRKMSGKIRSEMVKILQNKQR